MTYQEALTYLQELNTFGSKLGLVRIVKLLDLMGNPQNSYKTIHVTGTNGKGSTTAMLTAILAGSKIKTGMYTSPHLVSYTERMQINGKEISQEDFAECLELVQAKVGEMVAAGEENPTQFEVLTAVAFVYFAKMQVEYAVIEVGLGGLLDSTNVIVPEIAVITNVTFEHADRCGGSLIGIAEHKAGIIKDGIPVVTAATGKPLQILRDTAANKNSDLFVYNEDFESMFVKFDGKRQKIKFTASLMGIGLEYKLGMLGMHQVENSALAIMSALLLGNTEKRITRESICDSLFDVMWGGRFEIIRKGAGMIVIDGAHNLAGIQRLRENLAYYFPQEKIVFLIGILKDKDIDGMLETLIAYDDIVVVTEPISDRLAQADFVATRVKARQVEAWPVPAEALERALLLAREERLLCVAGSLYLIGELRKNILEKG